jgi:WD40 repeat protein
MGTVTGLLFIMDEEGNEIKEKKFIGHQAIINDLSIDRYGEYLASCSDDGKVIVHGLFNNERTEYVFNRPVRTVAIDPEYSKNTEKPIVAGGKSGKLTLYTKGWFGKFSETVIHEGEGDIFCVRWRKSFIVWANEKGVKIYDCITKTRIAFIARPKDAPRAEMYRCCISWIDNQPLGKEKMVIGWANTLKIIAISQQQNSKLPKCEVISSFAVDFSISGVCPFGDNLLILSYDEDEETQKSGKKIESAPAELRLFDTTGEEKLCDEVKVKDFKNLLARDYRFECFGAENVFYIMSQSDLVCARPRDENDHIKWLAENNKFKEALQLARDKEKQYPNTFLEVGQAYVTWLMDNQDYDLAAQSLPGIIKSDKALYEKWIYIFLKANKFDAIIPFIPIKTPRLDPTIYEMTLNYYLFHDHGKFFDCIKSWPNDMYDGKQIITLIKEKLEQQKYAQSEPILNALAALYEFDGQFDKTLSIYLKLKRTDAFEYITKHQLFSHVKDEVTGLIEFDEIMALELLVNNTDKIPVQTVIDQLSPLNQYKYLDALFKKNTVVGSAYHLRQVELYCQFDTPGIVSFLNASTFYNIEDAREICQKYVAVYQKDVVNLNNIYRGIVFLYGRLGQPSIAMDIIINKLNDVALAIEFVENQKEDDLWQVLINYSLSNSKFISGLLDNIGEHIDPISLVKKIPLGMEIPGLKMKLVKIISDFTIQMTLQKGCKAIMKADDKVLSTELHDKQRRGVRITPKSGCTQCKDSTQSGEDMIEFFCGHGFHLSCFQHEFFGEETALPPMRDDWNFGSLFGSKIHCLVLS